MFNIDIPFSSPITMLALSDSLIAIQRFSNYNFSIDRYASNGEDSENPVWVSRDNSDASSTQLERYLSQLLSLMRSLSPFTYSVMQIYRI